MFVSSTQSPLRETLLGKKGIAIALIHIVVVFALVNTKSLTFTEINSLSFLVRIGLGIYVSNVASNLGRNQVFWGFMGFFDSFVSLVILSSSPKLFSYEKEINDGIEIINEEFINKQNVISELKINSLIDDKEYDRKLAEIKDNYFEEINNFIENDSDDKVGENLIFLRDKLDEALSLGIITEEEYNNKVKNLNN